MNKRMMGVVGRVGLACVAVRAAGVVGVYGVHAAQPAGGYAKLSPFEGVMWVDQTPSVMVGGAWYGLVSIDGVTCERLLEYTREKYEDMAVKRFEEDLVQVMSEMGSPPGEKVKLVLRGAGGEEVVIPEAVMSHENRQRIRKGTSTRNVAAATGPLTRAEAEKELDVLATLLAEQHSYAAITKFDWRGAVVAAKAALPDGIGRREFGAVVAEVLAPIGDGHAGIAGAVYPDSEPYLPFLPVGVGVGEGARVVAVKADRSGLVDAGHPYVRAIDGVEIGRWLGECRKLVPHGSPQLVLDRSCRQLRSVGFLRERLGVTAMAEVAVELADAAGESSVVVKLGVSRSKPVFGAWPQRESGVLESGVGYVRLADMDDSEEFLAGLRGRLQGLAGAPGVVIDVRGNGGGSRAAIQVVADFVLGAGAAPIVYNASRPLKLPGDTPAELAERMGSRFLYPAEDRNWTEAERAEIGAFAAGFKPEIELPGARFGAWHYAVMSPTPHAGPAYGGRVAVLLDAGCFSATDVFLAAMTRVPGVVLVGTPSSGGSGMAQTHAVAKAEVRLSTMVSFQPDGKLFEGRGVMPHVRVEPVPGDLVSGGGDAVLDAALREIGLGRR